jgi:hypothetical protein
VGVTKAQSVGGLGCKLDDWCSQFSVGSMMGIFLFAGAHPGVPGALTPGVKWLGCEADHSPPSSAKVKNKWNSSSTPPISSLCSA